MSRSGPDAAAPLHLVVGAEPPVLAQTLEAVRQAHGLQEGDPGWEELHLDGGDLDPEGIHRMVAGRSLFASRRLVLVRRADELAAEAQEALLPFLDPLPPDLILVLAARQMDRRAALFKALKGAQVWDLSPPSRPGALNRWVQELASSQGLHLSPQAVARLVEGVGGEAALIPGEVAKLATYAAGGKAVTPADVDELLSTAWPGLPRYAVFDLLDAVSRGEAGPALERLRLLLRRGEPPLRLLGMLARQWHLLAVVRGLLSEGKGRPEEVARSAGVQPFEARKLVQLAAHWDEERLVQAVELTATADLEMKKGASAPTTLELLILRLSRLSRGAGNRRRVG